MAFDSLPRAEVDHLYDSGPIYVYEKGQFRSTTGFGPRPAKKLCPNPCPDWICKKLNADDIKSPFSLRTICVEYIAEHISIVESLEGFPDQVGEDIFEAVIRQGHLEDCKTQRAVEALRLFTDSYQQVVVSDVDLSATEGGLVSDILRRYQPHFCWVCRLDISNHRLQDGQDLLQWIGSLNNLTHLGLRNTSLSDKSMKMMTLPSRMYSRGPTQLEVLHLSKNRNITDSSIRYILGFKHLQDLEISGTNITMNGVKKIESSSSLRSVPTAEEPPQSVCDVMNMGGWAATVIQDWLSPKAHSEELPKSNVQEQPMSIFYSSNFYNKSKKSTSSMSNSGSEKKNRKILTSLTFMRLMKVQTSATVTLDKSDTSLAESDSTPSHSVSCSTGTGSKVLQPRDNHSLCGDSTSASSSFHDDAFPKRADGKFQKQTDPIDIRNQAQRTQQTNTKCEKVCKWKKLRPEPKKSENSTREQAAVDLSKYCSETVKESPKSLWAAMNSGGW